MVSDIVSSCYFLCQCFTFDNALCAVSGLAVVSEPAYATGNSKASGLSRQNVLFPTAQDTGRSGKFFPWVRPSTF